ncbi:cytochrome P450 [Aspergillus unguis]
MSATAVPYAQPLGLALLVAIAMIGVRLALLALQWKNQRGEFLNEKGQRIKEITVDVRLWKFVQSLELSQRGQQLAGEEPYLIRSGPYCELVISQPEHVHAFYEHDAKRHPKPKNLNLGEPFGRLAGNAVGTKYGDEWRRIRRYFDPPFVSPRAMENRSRFNVEIRQWIRAIAPAAETKVNVAAVFKFLTFRLLAIHLYGDAFDDRVYWRMLELNELHEGVIRDLLASRWPDSKLYNCLPTAANRKACSYLSQWRDFNRTIIEHARGGGWTCPVEVIYRGVDPDRVIREDEFLATLDEILFTNVDVSSKVLSMLFTQLAQKPSIQDALRAEIKASKGDPNLGEAKYVLKTDTLLNRVVMESMRMSPAFWFSMPESTAEPKKIGGYLVPADTPVIIDARRLNSKAATWGAHSADFDPDRFLGISPDRLRCGFMRFGAGAASGRCLGKNVADLVFKLVTIAALETFALRSLPRGEKGQIDDTDIELSRLAA